MKLYYSVLLMMEPILYRKQVKIYLGGLIVQYEKLAKLVTHVSLKVFDIINLN